MRRPFCSTPRSVCARRPESRGTSVSHPEFQRLRFPRSSWPPRRTHSAYGICLLPPSKRHTTRARRPEPPGTSEAPRLGSLSRFLPCDSCRRRQRDQRPRSPGICGHAPWRTPPPNWRAPPPRRGSGAGKPLLTRRGSALQPAPQPSPPYPIVQIRGGVELFQPRITGYASRQERIVRPWRRTRAWTDRGTYVGTGDVEYVHTILVLIVIFKP